MSKDKKPTTDELFARSQWNDNMAFSSKAIDESKKKTGLLDTSEPQNPQAPGTRPLNNYVNDMNQEINRMSDAVGNRMEHVGKGISRSFSKIVRPLGKSVNEVADSASEGFKSMSNGIGKAMLQEFTSVIRNLGDKVSPESATTEAESEVPQEEYDEAPPAPSSSPLTAKPLSSSFKSEEAKRPALPQADVETFDYHFGTLLERKVFFATIHNRTFLTERDIEEYNPEDTQMMYDWMSRGVEEIHNCAPYGQKLPIPQKGAYMNIPMYDILRQVDHRDLERFIRFVNNRPLPFQQKALKLSEAFATWAHKGAPER